MENTIKVSAILPSLNVVRYIRECVESVKNQLLQDIEILCVDAGSTDGTLEILKEYEKSDPRIKVIISDRKSYGYQMNLGMSAARGEYISIVETDDYIPEEMYEELYKIARENTVDFVKADFYRFTGEGEDRIRTVFHLSDNGKYYHRIIDIQKKPECFLFPINTWSGIYSRDYLMKYSICHNETAGASFQDNGFWFQTFAYAKRAFFIDKPYYMNRRDNECSSVFSKDKTYCVCDEYDFIKEKMSAGKELCKWKPVYSLVCFRTYLANLDRIIEDDEENFLKRFSEDFCKLQDQKVLDLQLFSEEEKETLFTVMDNPEYFYKHSNILRKKHVLNRIRSYDDVIIYGAGVVGKNILNELSHLSRPIKVRCFAVSERQGNAEDYQGVPVCEIQDLLDYREKGLIIIAVSPKYQLEMRDTLKHLGFQHILELSEYRNGVTGE